MSCSLNFAAAVIVVLAVVIAVVVAAKSRKTESFLVYPYLDLDEPGVRGSPYALAECSR
jgi:hypothetical protein